MSIFAEIISDGAISLRPYGEFWEPVKATPTNPTLPETLLSRFQSLMPTAMGVHRGGASQGMELKIRVPDLSLGRFRVDRDAWPGNGRLRQGVMLLFDAHEGPQWVDSSPSRWGIKCQILTTSPERNSRRSNARAARCGQHGSRSAPRGAGSPFGLR
jgi:hypothetical protein